MTKLRVPIRGTVYELTEAGITTKYKRSLRGLVAWFKQYLCQHWNEDQTIDLHGILCHKCGWARTGKPEVKALSDRLPLEKSVYGGYRDTFCAKCLTHERLFKGGHSWSPDLCPCGEQDTITWEDMSLRQRRKAQTVYQESRAKK